jgi:hypothetical protein
MAYTGTFLPSPLFKYFHYDKITHRFFTESSLRILLHHIPLLSILRQLSQSNEWKLVNEPRIEGTLHSTRNTNSQTRDWAISTVAFALSSAICQPLFFLQWAVKIMMILKLSHRWWMIGAPLHPLTNLFSEWIYRPWYGGVAISTTEGITFRWNEFSAEITRRWSQVCNKHKNNLNTCR